MNMVYNLKFRTLILKYCKIWRTLYKHPLSLVSIMMNTNDELYQYDLHKNMTNILLHDIIIHHCP